ncbi:MAG: 5-oxoprolinase subunit PxpB [Lawsonibacter sp.]
MENTKILPAGDSAVSVQFGNSIDLETYEKVRILHHQLTRSKFPGIVETLPTYRSLMVHYDPQLLPYHTLVSKLNKLLSTPEQADAFAKKTITIPVCFGCQYGEDLESVAAYHSTTPEEIVRLFCASSFLIYMLGFTPGYPYIGGVPKELATPRLKTPRVKIPAGAVGIGGEQLGIYPLESPGGFQLVGRTPVHLYDPDRETPVLLEAGEYIRFQSVTPAEYEKIKRQVDAGTYICQIKEG